MLRRVGVLVAALLLASGTIPASSAEIPIPQRGFRSAIVIAPDEVRTLYAYHADAQVPPASLAKMIVALIAAERLAPDDTVKISRAAAVAEADEVRWPQGATFSVDQVMHGMLMESSNGAAIALAERISGSVAAFVPLMASRAAFVGATHTRILDPSGLDAPGQYSTARDLAWMAAAVLADPWLAGIVRAKSYAVAWPGGKRLTFRNRNRFMSRYAGAVGVKNGYTTKAGNCVAAAAGRGGRTIIAVVLGDQRVFDDAATLLDRGFKMKPAPVTAEFAMGGGARHQRGIVASVPSQRAGAQPRLVLIVVAGLLVSYSSRVWQVRRRVLRKARARGVRA